MGRILHYGRSVGAGSAPSWSLQRSDGHQLQNCDGMKLTLRRSPLPRVRPAKRMHDHISRTCHSLRLARLSVSWRGQRITIRTCYLRLQAGRLYLAGRKSNCDWTKALGEDFKPWRFHDLRTAFASHMAKTGAPEGVVDRVLNHAASASKASVVARSYQLSDLLDQRAAILDRWAAEVTAGEVKNIHQIGRKVSVNE